MSRLASQVSPEYTWYMESTERREDGPDPANPTNNIVVPLHMARRNLPVQQINLSSIELPLAQYVVENQWSRLYFSEGLKLLGDALTGDGARNFTVRVNGSQYVAQLPLFLNPIVDVDDSDPAAPVFTTQFDHALDMRGQWTWEPVQLIATPLTQADDGDLVNLTADNPNLTVIDSRRFRLSNVAGAPAWTATASFGYVYAPAVPSPSLLATVTTAALNLVLPGAFVVTYSPETGLFSFQSLRTIVSCRTLAPVNTTDSIYLVIASRNTLPALMGFGVGTVSVPPTQVNYTPSNQEYFGSAGNLAPADCAAPGSCREVVLAGGYGYQCASYVTLDEGNYDHSGFAGQTNFQFNRFYFNPGETADPANQSTFVFANQENTFFTVAVPYGQYTPETFADFLQAAMNLADPLTDSYTVTYTESDGLGQFCFSADVAFSLEFGHGTDNVFPRIGFQGSCYRGQTEYCGENIRVPIVQCCGSSIPTRRPGSLHTLVLNTSTSKACYHSCARPCVHPVAATPDADNTLHVSAPLSSAFRAHGFQPNDVVSLRTDAGVVHQMPVLQVPDYRTLYLDAGSTGVGAQADATVCPYEEPHLNLFFNTSLRNGVHARYYGFPAADQLDEPGVAVRCSPYCLDLSTPSHVLVVVDDPKGATHNNHAVTSESPLATHGRGNIANVLAKVILYPQFRLERLMSFTMYVPEVVNLERMSLRILNPDHTEYQFHGKNWSASFSLMVVVNTSAQLIAY